MKMHATAIRNILEIENFTKKLITFTHNKKMIAFINLQLERFKHLAHKMCTYMML